MKQFYIWRTEDNKSHEIFTGSEEEFLSIKEFFCKAWKLNGKWHRDDGPAMIYSNGAEYWCRNGNYHRINGPARAWSDGSREYWINGNRLKPGDLYIIDEYKKEIDRLKEIEIEHNKLKDKLKNIFSV